MEEEGRAGVLRRGLVTTVVSRGSAAVVPLLMVPIALNHLGARDYGAWQAALALTAVVAFADLGIGTGLMTRLGKAQVSGESGNSQRIIASGYFMVTLVATVCLAVLVASSYWVSWSGVLGVSEEEQTGTLDLIVVLTLASVVVNMVASLIVRVQFGVNQQATSNLWQTVGSFGGLGGAYIATLLTENSPWFVALAMFTPPVVAIANTLWFFTVNQTGRIIRPRITQISLGSAGLLLKLGLKFFIISLLMTVAISLDPWIVGRVADLESVPDYSIAARIFSTLGTTIALMSAALWPLNAQALASGDGEWVKRISRLMSIRLTAAMSVLSIAAVAVGPIVIDLWLDNQIRFDQGLWVALAAWWVIQSAVGPYFMVQNGGEVLFPQIVAFSVFALIVVPAKFWFLSNWGAAAMVWAGTVAYVAIVVPACIVGYRLTLKQLRDTRGSEAYYGEKL